MFPELFNDSCAVDDIGMWRVCHKFLDVRRAECEVTFTEYHEISVVVRHRLGQATKYASSVPW